MIQIIRSNSVRDSEQPTMHGPKGTEDAMHALCRILNHINTGVTFISLPRVCPALGTGRHRVQALINISWVNDCPKG